MIVLYIYQRSLVCDFQSVLTLTAGITHFMHTTLLMAAAATFVNLVGDEGHCL